MTAGRNAYEGARDGSQQSGLGKLVAVCAVGFVLQALVGCNIAIGGVSPNFFLIALVAVASFSSQRAAIVSGFVLGLLFDLMGTGPVGGMALLLTLIGFVLGSVTQNLKVESIITWIVMVAAAALASSIAYCIVMAIAGYEQAFFAALVFKALPWTLYTIVLAAILWPAVKRLNGAKRAGPLDSRISL